MPLADLQRDIQSVCLDREPSEAALARLGDPRIWGVYRQMVRRRLLGELKHAFRRTFRDAGGSLFEAAFDRHMAEDPPRDRRFFGIPACFAPSAITFFESHPEAPAHLPDLVRFEAARWEVSDLDDRAGVPPQLSELSFEGRPVLSPALRVLSLEHAVHRKPAEDGYAKGRFYVALHRAGDDQPVRQWGLNRTTHALVRYIHAHPQASLTEAVQAVSGELNLVVDDAFLEGLCAVLADFVERRILLGSC